MNIAARPLRYASGRRSGAPVRGRSIAAIALGSVLQLAAAAEPPAELPNFRVSWNAINPVTPLNRRSFSAPDMRDRPWARLNMPSTADPSELRSEVEELHASGIAGIEVGQGAFPNEDQLVAILQEANNVGIKVSLSHGPTQYPPGYSIDDDDARKTLAFGNVIVGTGATFDGPLPPPQPPPKMQFRVPHTGAGARVTIPPSPPEPETRNTLIAVLAYRCRAPGCAKDQPAILEPATALDLTSLVSARNSAGIGGGTTTGRLQWSPPDAPSNAQWQLIAFWTHGVFAQPDPFSREGFNQLIASMDGALSPAVKALMRANGGDLFYDSHTVDRGSPDEIWTNNMQAEFSKRTGYSLIPALAALFPTSFAFSDDSDRRIRNDLYAVRGDLWISTQLLPLEKWARSLNAVLRVQPEGEMSPTTPITDQVQAAAVLDRPEHESLFANDEVDAYLPIASANHMTGNSWYSTECCAALNMNYAQTLQDMAIRMHRSYAGGITKLVYHVFPYRDSPTSKWPGYHNFGQAGFSNAWGPRDPDWIDARRYNDYLARLAQVLTQGRARTDVAVYMQNYLYPQPMMVADGAGFRLWRDTKLQEAGYTRDYLDPELLSTATMSAKRLAPTGPAYKALVIDAELQPASDPDKHSMPLATAQRVLWFAKQGLPIIVVGSAPDHVPGNNPAQDTLVQQVMAELLAHPAVRRVAHESDVPAALLALGIQPSAQTAAPGPLLSARRRDEAADTDYYFLYHQGVVSPEGEPANLFKPGIDEHLRTQVTLEGHGRPYLLDAWSGNMTPIALYQTHGNRITVNLDLVRDDATVIAVGEGNFDGARTSPVHAVKTSADSARWRGDTLTVRAFKDGSYATTLNNGRTRVTTAKLAVPPMDLTDAPWTLDVEDWAPAHPYETTEGSAATATLKSQIRVALQGLKPWPDIEPLQHSSGVGIYATRFELPVGWTRADGTMLNLGEVSDSFELWVNGRAVPINQLSAQADIGPYLKAGRNTLTVRVATTLNNRLANLDRDVEARGIVQRYGLIGPVLLRPYQDMKVFGPSHPPRKRS